MLGYSGWLIRNPPMLLYGLTAIHPPGGGYLLLTTNKPLLLTNFQIFALT